MKHLFVICLLSLFLANCGRDLGRFGDNNSYTINEDLAVTGTVSFTYRKTYDLRADAFRTSAEQASRCNEIASEYQLDTGISMQPDSLKVHLDGPEKNCLHRNGFNGCDRYEYIYTITCLFRANQ